MIKGNRGLQRFDPFNDRMSRDIRNTLSEAFVDALAKRNPASFEEAARTWLNRVDAGIYEHYIEERLGLYRRVFQIIEQERLQEPLSTALVVWNQGLFFEFHDHLERIWRETTGEMHQALKGLIKAAGVYIHLQYDRPQAAGRLANKSIDLLRSH